MINEKFAAEGHTSVPMSVIRVNISTRLKAIGTHGIYDASKHD